jgi:phage baseplate assembly protein V
MYQIDEIEDIKKRISNLIQVGNICEVDPQKALARVSILGRVTNFLPVLSISNSFKKHWVPAQVNEQVLVLSPFGSYDSGFILRGIYNKSLKEPQKSSSNNEIVEFSDGTTVEYNTEEKTVRLETNGEITIKAKKINLESEEIDFKVKNKINIGNGSDDILGLISEHVQSLIKDAKTATTLGPQNLFCPKFEITNKKIKDLRGR